MLQGWQPWWQLQWPQRPLQQWYSVLGWKQSLLQSIAMQGFTLLWIEDEQRTASSLVQSLVLLHTDGQAQQSSGLLVIQCPAWDQPRLLVALLHSGQKFID